MSIRQIRRFASFLIGFLMSFASQAQIPSPGYISFDPNRHEAIVFVHGVIGDAKETWTNPDTKAYWPELIRKDNINFSDANVYVFGYVTTAIKNAQDISELASKFGDELRFAGVFEKHERVYFIAHSMGGLIVREMLDKVLPVPTMVPLIYFYGTPSAGAEIAGIASAISVNPQFSNMKPFSRGSDVKVLADHWLSTAENKNAQYPLKVFSFCAYEIEGFALGRVVVGSLSASFLCNTTPRGILQNHVGLVKPKNTRDEPYVSFVSAYDFVHSATAALLRGGAIGGATLSTRQIDIAALASEKVYVDLGKLPDCHQTSFGSVRLSNDDGGRVVAARVLDAPKSIDFTIVKDELQYRIEGSRNPCSNPTTARVMVEYVREVPPLGEGIVANHE